jgi:hypothetical protein
LTILAKKQKTQKTNVDNFGKKSLKSKCFSKILKKIEKKVKLKKDY